MLQDSQKEGEQKRKYMYVVSYDVMLPCYCCKQHSWPILHRLCMHLCRWDLACSGLCRVPTRNCGRACAVVQDGQLPKHLPRLNGAQSLASFGHLHLPLCQKATAQTLNIMQNNTQAGGSSLSASSLNTPPPPQQPNRLKSAHYYHLIKEAITSRHVTSHTHTHHITSLLPPHQRGDHITSHQITSQQLTITT